MAKHDWKNCPDNPNFKKNAGSNDKSKSHSRDAGKDKEKSKDQKTKKKTLGGENFSTEWAGGKSNSRVKFDCDQMLLDDEQNGELVTDNAEIFIERIKGQDTQVQKHTWK